jgi:hypothetical protein
MRHVPPVVSRSILSRPMLYRSHPTPFHRALVPSYLLSQWPVPILSHLHIGISSSHPYSSRSVPRSILSRSPFSSPWLPRGPQRKWLSGDGGSKEKAAPEVPGIWGVGEWGRGGEGDGEGAWSKKLQRYQTLNVVLTGVYRLEIQLGMLVFSTPLVS